MREQLPHFRYHPNPLATNAVKAADATCACCNSARRFTVDSHYGVVRYDCICPWCVADGSAAEKLGASFVQDIEEGVSQEICDEVNFRTPGYSSWQGELWLTHCDDACAFHGDLPQNEVNAIPSDDEALFLNENDWLDDWADLKSAYAEGKTDVALYKFICLHCGVWRIGIDFT